MSVPQILKRRKNHPFSLAALLCFILLVLANGAWAQVFKFTAIPDQNSARLEERFDKVANYLSEVLGQEVQYVPVKSYSASVSAFRNNQVQLAWFGGLSGVQARRGRPGGQAIAQGEEDQHFMTYFIAHSSTGLQAGTSFPAEIAGKTFTFGSKSSTSGRLMPEFYIRQFLDGSPEDIFRRVGFSGDHSQTIALVQAGSYQVGAVNFQVWENELAAGLIDPDQVRVIWKTPHYPDYNWTIRADVDAIYGEGFSDKVQNALVNMTDPSLLASFPRKGFIKTDNSNYQPILDTAISVGLISD